jgi:hypothetical protein
VLALDHLLGSELAWLEDKAHVSTDWVAFDFTQQHQIGVDLSCSWVSCGDTIKCNLGET